MLERLGFVWLSLTLLTLEFYSERLGFSKKRDKRETEFAESVAAVGLIFSKWVFKEGMIKGVLEGGLDFRWERSRPQMDFLRD
jgi:hypothetical protein